MANNADNVRVAGDGKLYVDFSGSATAPTGTASAMTGWDDLGYTSEDGFTLSPPSAGDTSTIKAWQGQAIVRVIRSTTDELPTIQATFIETNENVLKEAFGIDTVTQTSTEGSFVFDPNTLRVGKPFVADVVDNGELMRIYAPSAVVTEIGEVTFNATDPVGYQITWELENDTTLGGSFKLWSTGLKTPA